MWMTIIPFIIVFALPGVLLISVIIRGLTLPRGLRRGRAAVCGRCSQEVADITESSPLPLRCPECGTKYAYAGLLSLGLAKRNRPGMASVIVSWSLLAAAAGITATAIVSSFSANNYTTRQRFSHTIESVRTDGTVTTNTDGYEVRFDGELEFAFGSPVRSGSLTLTVFPDNGPSASIDIDPGTGSWSIPTTGDTGVAFDRNAAFKALEAAGINTGPAYVGFEAGELTDAVQLVRTRPDTAVYSVLGNYGNSFPQQTATTPFTTNWSPRSLAVTGQNGDSANGLRFSFESDMLDANYAGSSSTEAYNGGVEFEFAGAQASAQGGPNSPKVTAVTINIRPPEGWPVSARYDLTTKTGTLTQGESSEEYLPADDKEAIRKIAEITGLADGAGSYDPGLRDILDLVEDVRRTPDKYDLKPAGNTGGGHAHNQNWSPGHATANSAGDGEPDGGFVETRPATQNWMSTGGGFQNAFPVGVMITIGTCLLIYAGGIALIVVRRFRIYPTELVGPQGPPNPDAVGPGLPGNTPRNIN